MTSIGIQSSAKQKIQNRTKMAAQRRRFGKYEIFMLRRLGEGSFTLRGLAAELAKHGLKVDDHLVSNFVHA